MHDTYQQYYTEHDPGKTASPLILGALPDYGSEDSDHMHPHFPVQMAGAGFG